MRMRVRVFVHTMQAGRHAHRRAHQATIHTRKKKQQASIRLLRPGLVPIQLQIHKGLFYLKIKIGRNVGISKYG